MMLGSRLRPVSVATWRRAALKTGDDRTTSAPARSFTAAWTAASRSAAARAGNTWICRRRVRAAISAAFI